MRAGINGGESSEAPEELTMLVLPRWLRDAILDHMRCELPSEGVGLLAAKPNPLGDSIVAAAAFYPGQNQDRSSIRYTMRSNDVAVALRDMTRRGHRLGAVVHSHPRTPPTPSATDLAEAIGPGVLLVIVGMTPAPVIRAWQMVQTSWRAEAGYREVSVVESVSEAALRAVEVTARSHER